MSYLVQRFRLPVLLGAAGLALALTGCAVVPADGYGYGYDGYDAYGPVYVAPGYPVPAGPPMIYGAPQPLFWGGQVWMDPPRRPAPPRWRDDQRWHENGRPGSSWQHDQGRWQHQRPPARPPSASQQGNLPAPAQRPGQQGHPGYQNDGGNHGGWGGRGGYGARDMP